MKKLLICLLTFLIIAFTVPAYALTVAWDQHTDINVAGYTLYWQEQGTTEQFRVDLASRAITQYVIEDKFFKIGATYDLWLTAYNDQENSGSSNVIQFIRTVNFLPPESNLPVTEYDPEAPTTITITAGP